MTIEQPIIRDNVSDFSDDEQQHDFDEHGEPSNYAFYLYCVFYINVLIMLFLIFIDRLFKL